MSKLIYPVIMAVPSLVFDCKNKRSFIRSFAKRSVQMSSDEIGFPIGTLSKDEYGVPSRCDSFYWSVTHKTKYVAGVVAFSLVGIDIEEVFPRSEGLCKKIATQYEWNHEWNLSAEEKMRQFFRYWTAKEAVLKAERIGLSGLKNCSIEEVIDKTHMLVRYAVNVWCVEHFYFDNHIASVAFDHFGVSWSIYDKSGDERLI